MSTRTDTPEIQPALLPESWKDLLAIGPMPVLPLSGAHALAALSLHEHPFGFGWPDHDLLIDMALSIEQAWNAVPSFYPARADEPAMAEARAYKLTQAAQFRDLAGRIAALLAPR